MKRGTMKSWMMPSPAARWAVNVSMVAIACGLSMQASAATIAIDYSLTGTGTGTPVLTNTTATFDSLSTVSVLSGNPNLNAVWNPVMATDHNVVDFTTGLNHAAFNWIFSDGSTLFGTLLEDVSHAPMGAGPFTQTFTFTGGTAEFAGATGSVSGAGVGTATGFTSSGSGSINAPAIPEPASAALSLGGLAFLLVSLRRFKPKSRMYDIAGRTNSQLGIHPN
jgi:hypothetical protein